MAWGWTRVWEVGGEQREKMGIQLKGKKGAMPPEEERRGDGKARGMSMAGRGGAGPPFLARVCPGAPSPPGSLLPGLG